VANQRKTYLINPKFQVKFAIYICVLLFVSSIIYPITIYDIMTSFIEFAAEKSSENKALLEERRTSLIILLAVWQIGFTIIVAIAAIFFGHKIAGPLYKLKKFLRGIREDGSYTKLVFRKGDYFQELADEFNNTFEYIRDKNRSDFIYLEEVSTYLNNLTLIVPDDKKTIIDEINKRLSEIQSRYNS
jgi:hypothetical protein